MSSRKPVVIFGTGDLALVLSRYMKNDGDNRQAAFCVDRNYINEPELEGYEVVAFEEVLERFPPDRFEMIVAMGYTRVNQARAEVFEKCRAKGYAMASFIGSQVIRAEPLKTGENCIVLDGAILQPFVELKNNVVVWGQAHVGHHSVLEDHVFLAGGGVAGRSRIGAYTFIGATASVSDNVTIGKRNLIGAGVAITQDTGEELVFRAPKPKPSPVPSSRLWK